MEWCRQHLRGLYFETRSEAWDAGKMNLRIISEPARAPFQKEGVRDDN